MKTLADFKRALSIGSKWEAINHFNIEPYNMGIREVVQVKSNQVGFQLMYDSIVSWLSFPKASEFNVNSNGEVEIYWPESTNPNCPRERKLIMTYRKI